MGWDHLPTPQYFICPCVFLVPANAAPCGKVTEEPASSTQHIVVLCNCNCKAYLNSIEQSKSLVTSFIAQAITVVFIQCCLAWPPLPCSATHVPVGEDQLQHLELARDIARSFNARHGALFQEPQPLLGVSHGVQVM